jgi:transcriptional regulator with XRE-family HTH domain
MRKIDWIQGLRASREGRQVLERERVWLEATESLCRLMDSQGVSSAELARRLDISPARVSHILSGERNLTLATLADAFHALGRSIHVTHGPPTDRVVVSKDRGAGRRARRGTRATRSG